MQKQMGGISSTKADKLLKKAKKMNNQMFNEGGVKMAKKGEDPFKGDKPTGKTDQKGRKQYRRPDGSTYFRAPGGDDEKIRRKMAKGGSAMDILKSKKQMKITSDAQYNPPSRKEDDFQVFRQFRKEKMVPKRDAAVRERLQNQAKVRELANKLKQKMDREGVPKSKQKERLDAFYKRANIVKRLGSEQGFRPTAGMVGALPNRELRKLTAEMYEGKKPKKFVKGGTAQSNNAKKSRGAGAMIKGTTFRGVY